MVRDFQHYRAEMDFARLITAFVERIFEPVIVQI